MNSTRKDGGSAAAVSAGEASGATPRTINVNHAPYKSAEAKPFWAAVAEQRLVLQRCTSCNHVRFPPRHLCPQCWSSDMEWFTASGRGHVHSFTVVHRAPTPVFQKKAPYVITIVDLEEGPRMVSNIVGEDALDIRIGDPVVVAFDTVNNIPQFRRSTNAFRAEGNQ